MRQGDQTGGYSDCFRGKDCIQTHLAVLALLHLMWLAHVIINSPDNAAHTHEVDQHTSDNTCKQTHTAIRPDSQPAVPQLQGGTQRDFRSVKGRFYIVLSCTSCLCLMATLVSWGLKSGCDAQGTSDIEAVMLA